jgi:hypothetical protein
MMGGPSAGIRIASRGWGETRPYPDGWGCGQEGRSAVRRRRGFGVARIGADRIDSLEVGEHQDMGSSARGGAEGFQTGSKPLFEFIGTHEGER